MIVYFSGSARHIEEDIHKYRVIVNVVRALGHSVGNDWTETSWLMSQGKGKFANGWDLKDIVLVAEAGIEMSEVSIVEASGSSTLGVGYELALALQKKKPVLILVDKKMAPDSYAAALNHDLLTIKEYDSIRELEAVIEAFIQENTIQTKDLRFNFVIDRQIYNYLRQKSFKTGKPKAEIVRDLLLDDLRERND